MVDAHIHKAPLVNQIGDPIGDSLAIGQGQNIIHIDIGLLSFGLPFPSPILNIARQFLFLAIDRDDRMAVLLKRFAGAVDMVKLSIPIRMRRPLMLFLLTCKENPSSCKLSARADFLTRCPLAFSASTR